MPFSEDDLKAFGDKLMNPLTLTQADLDAIRARAEVATPGPWEARSKGHFTVGREIGCEIAGNINSGTSTPVCQLWPGFKWYEGDKEFIANSRSDIPALLLEIEALRRACYHYATQVGRWAERGKR